MQTRALTAVGGPEDAEVVNFLCGTQSLRTENQVHEIGFDQTTETASTRVFTFPAGEIWFVSCFNTAVIAAEALTADDDGFW